MTYRLTIIYIIAAFPLHTLSCKSVSETEKQDSNPTDPSRCVVEDVGEAADFILKPGLRDDRMVVAHGLANPQALIWRDDNIKKTFYIARVLGTEKRLYYLRPVADDETPGVASHFEGRFLKWSHLDPRRRVLLSDALRQNYNIEFEHDKTYIIIHGERPEGCR